MKQPGVSRELNRPVYQPSQRPYQATIRIRTPHCSWQNAAIAQAIRAAPATETCSAGPSAQPGPSAQHCLEAVRPFCSCQLSR